MKSCIIQLNNKGPHEISWTNRMGLMILCQGSRNFSFVHRWWSNTCIISLNIGSKWDFSWFWWNRVNFASWLDLARLGSTWLDLFLGLARFGSTYFRCEKQHFCTETDFACPNWYSYKNDMRIWYFHKISYRNHIVINKSDISLRNLEDIQYVHENMWFV